MSNERKCSIVRPGGYHVGHSLRVLQMGRFDPCLALGPDAFALALHTPEGSATLEVVQRSGTLEATLWGEGATWLEARLEGLLGLQDHPELFEPRSRLLRDLKHRFAGMHLPHLPVVSTRLIQVVLLQLVTWHEALRSFKSLVLGLGEPAPGPRSLMLPPHPDVLASTPTCRLMEYGVLEQQARTIQTIAKSSKTIERAALDGPHALAKVLIRMPGIGPWTIEYTLGSALGVADAVLLGDYKLPSAVSWALAGEPRADDGRMLELLAPYSGHRFRVIRLLWMAAIEPPRRAPKRNHAHRYAR